MNKPKVLLALSVTLELALGTTTSADFRVSPDNVPGSYRRLDGSEDEVHAACSTRKRQQAEPSVAVNPHNPNVIVAAAMDTCIAVRNQLPIPQAQHWGALYRSTDAGQTWSASLLPGYPGDFSPEGLALDLGDCVQQGDVTVGFDADGRLYYGSLCIIFPGGFPVDFQIAVATFEEDGSHFVRRARVDRPSDPAGEILVATDKPNLAVDQTGGPHSGNIYVAWSECPRIVPERGPESVAPCVGREGVIKVARSTDHAKSFDSPVTITSTSLERPNFADLAVGSDGAVYLTFYTPPDDAGLVGIWLSKSTDGGQTFTTAGLVEKAPPFRSIQFAGTQPAGPFPPPPPNGAANGGSPCGDGPFACPSGYTFPPFRSSSAVTADETGVHVVWNARLPGGQSKIFVRNSPDGVQWPQPALAIDSVPAGHQWMADVTSANGRISAIFYDSRNDPAYDPNLPPGNTASGTNPGPAVDAWLAQSTDAGLSWTETRLSSLSFQPNYETYLDARAPWMGDYIYISSEPGGKTFAVWTDSRDVVPGTDARSGNNADGFDVHAPCEWNPNTQNPPLSPLSLYLSPSPKDACFDQGGLDVNVYGSWVTEPR